MRWLIVFIALLGSIAPLDAQRLQVDPDWCLTCSDSWQHFAAGAGIDVGVRLLFQRSRPGERLLLVATIGVTWELGQADATERRGPGYGFSPKDLLLDVAGAVLVELLWPRRSP